MGETGRNGDSQAVLPHSSPNERGNFLHNGKCNVLPSGKLGATVSDLCEHVDQPF